MVRRIIIFTIVGLSVAAFAAQTLSQTQNPSGTIPMPDWNRLKNMTAEERTKEMQRIQKLRLEQMKIQSQRARDLAEDEAYRQLIGATEKQWLELKPKIEKVRDAQELVWVAIHLKYFKDDPNANSSKEGDQSEYKYLWKWNRPSERNKSDESDSVHSGGGGYGGGMMGGYGGGGFGESMIQIKQPKKTDELIEGQKICEELLNILEDKNASEDDIRQKVEALRKVRQKGKEELTKAQQELRKAVTFRQEAALVKMGLLP